MSKPMLIPKNLRWFRHPHVDPVRFGRFLDPFGTDCETPRPYIDPDLVRYMRSTGMRSIRVWLACGEEIEWELPDA